MSDHVYQDETKELLNGGGYFETRGVNGRVVGLYSPERKHYVTIIRRPDPEPYYPEMTDCHGTFPGISGPIAYHSYVEYIDKIEEEFACAMAIKIMRELAL